NSSLGSMSYWATDPIYRYDTTNPWYIFSRTVYDKGAWVLHMLRHVVGDSMLFDILHNYPNDSQFSFGTATTEQFRDFCEQTSGMNLNDFFQVWIYEPYFPVYDWGYVYQPTQTGHSLYLEITQTQDQVNPSYTHIYKMPIDIKVNYVDGTSETFVLWNTQRNQNFTVTLDTVPLSVMFDPDKWILKQEHQVVVTVEEPGEQIASDFLLEQNYPNPFNPTTNIGFRIEDYGFVELKIFNVTGGEVKTLISKELSPGDYDVRWDGHNDVGQSVASGVYVYRLKSGNQLAVRKMVLLR
ncbi:MAG: M1 family aminopeptidase, partial [Calditrichia bacterium]